MMMNRRPRLKNEGRTQQSTIDKENISDKKSGFLKMIVSVDCGCRVHQKYSDQRYIWSIVNQSVSQ